MVLLPLPGAQDEHHCIMYGGVVVQQSLGLENADRIEVIPQLHSIQGQRTSTQR